MAHPYLSTSEPNLSGTTISFPAASVHFASLHSTPVRSKQTTMSSTRASTTPDDRPPSKNPPEPSHRAMTGPGGAGEPDAAAPPPNFSSPFHEALFILLIGSSQLFSVGGLGNTAYSVQPIGRALGATGNAQRSWFLSAYALSGGVAVLVDGPAGRPLRPQGRLRRRLALDGGVVPRHRLRGRRRPLRLRPRHDGRRQRRPGAQLVRAPGARVPPPCRSGRTSLLPFSASARPRATSSAASSAPPLRKRSPGGGASGSGPSAPSSSAPPVPSSSRTASAPRCRDSVSGGSTTSAPSSALPVSSSSPLRGTRRPWSVGGSRTRTRFSSSVSSSSSPLPTPSHAFRRPCCPARCGRAKAFPPS